MIVRHQPVLFLAALLTACADSAGPPNPGATADAPIAAARSFASGTTTLPTFGGSEAQAKAINDGGTVVGYATEANPSRNVIGAAYAAKWARAADGRWVATRLGMVGTTKPAPGGRALALNEQGDAVGTRSAVALVWRASGGEIELVDGAVAEGINSAGIIVGGTAWGNGGTALVWTPDVGSATGWTSHSLPQIEGGAESHAFAINEAGVIVGTAATAEGRFRAVVWLPEGPGVWSAPVPLSGTEVAHTGGFGINISGDVVGYQSLCSATGCRIHAYFWPGDGGSPTDLAMLNSSTSSGHARGIEDGRRVVGFINVPRGNGLGPFLWAPGDAALTDLGTGEANDINNGTGRYGQEAVGFGWGSKGSQAIVWHIP